MKSSKFHINLFDITIQYLEVESEKDASQVRKHLKKINLPQNGIEEIIENIENKITNGGECVFNPDRQPAIIIIVYPCTSLKKKIDVISHEKRHAEDYILQHFHIKDMETAGFLAGVLGKFLFGFKNSPLSPF